MSEYIPVSEFAKEVGVTTQSIYKRKGLQPFINKRTTPFTIDIKAFEIYNKKQSSTGKPTILNDKETTVDNGKQPLSTVVDEAFKILSSQLSEKDKQIERLDAQIIALNDHLKAKDIQIEKLIQLNHQNQVLLLEKKDQPLVAETQTVETTVVDGLKKRWSWPWSKKAD